MLHSFQFTDVQVSGLLEPSDPLQAFNQTADLLEELQSLGESQLLLRGDDSYALRQQFFAQVEDVGEVPPADLVLTLSLAALGAGLASGATDGALLYVLQIIPSPVPAADYAEWTQDAMAQSVQVAHSGWRELDADTLQLQAGYGKHLNRSTHVDNAEYLARSGRGPEHARKVFTETFRTGYSLGLIDAAVVFLAGQRPDPLPPG